VKSVNIDKVINRQSQLDHSVVCTTYHSLLDRWIVCSWP